MPKTVNIHEAKTHLSRLVEEVVQGETVIIAKAGQALVELSPVAPPSERQPGRLKGRIVTRDEDLLAPLTGEELRDWESAE